jgi:hypothetical protein
MVKTCVASEFGPEVFALLTIVAHTEDAAHYRRPVTFYNPILMPLVGCRSESTFKRVRDKAVKAGWLVYIPGNIGKPAKYWVTIPDHATGLDDQPTDEGFKPTPEIDPQDELTTDSGWTQDELSLNSERPTFNPIPDPIPDPVNTLSDPAGSDDAPPEESGPGYQELLDLEREFVTVWNSLEGNVHSQTAMLTPKRRTWFRARLKDKPPWRWREALAKFPLQCLVGRKSWADLEWFLKHPDSVTKILEGKYDWSPNGNRSQKHDPTRIGGQSAPFPTDTTPDGDDG